MKNKIKNILPSIFLSFLVGITLGRILFRIYELKNSLILESKTIYLLSDNSYKDYDEMKVSTLNSSYVYYKDNDTYNRVVAITKNIDNIKKIENAYNKTLKVDKYLLNDKEIISKIDEYDIFINNAKENSEVQAKVLELLNIYKTRENIKLTKIS